MDHALNAKYLMECHRVAVYRIAMVHHRIAVLNAQSIRTVQATEHVLKKDVLIPVQDLVVFKHSAVLLITRQYANALKDTLVIHLLTVNQLHHVRIHWDHLKISLIRMIVFVF